MTSAATEPNEFVVLRGVPWECYEKVLHGFGNYSWRHCYNRGTLTICSTGHVNRQAVIGMRMLVHTLTLELEVELQSVGKMTIWSPDKECGIEPDESFYLTNEPLVRCKMDYTPDSDPPPDLTIDGSLGKERDARLAVFARMVVPEIWSYDPEGVRFRRLTEFGTYEEIERSIELPGLTSQIVQEHLERRRGISDTAFMLGFRDWVRANLK